MRRALLLWLLRMACADAALWGAYAALAAQQPASRRACNAAYMAWLLALNLLLLLALACVDALSRALGAHGAQARDYMHAWLRLCSRLHTASWRVPLPSSLLCTACQAAQQHNLQRCLHAPHSFTGPRYL
jgi:hypothetical protein